MLLVPSPVRPALFFLLIGLFGLLLGGCTGSNRLSAPTDTQAGQQIAIPLNESDAPFGYYQYLPPDYAQKASGPHPLLVFLHGSGERGDGTSRLARVRRHGPPRVIQANEWPSSRPFIVLSPQLDSTAGA